MIGRRPKRNVLRLNVNLCCRRNGTEEKSLTLTLTGSHSLCHCDVVELCSRKAGWNKFTAFGAAASLMGKFTQTTVVFVFIQIVALLLRN